MKIQIEVYMCDTFPSEIIGIAKCRKSKILLQLMKKEIFTQEDLFLIKKLGIEIEYEKKE